MAPHLSKSNPLQGRAQIDVQEGLPVAHCLERSPEPSCTRSAARWGGVQRRSSSLTRRGPAS